MFARFLAPSACLLVFAFVHPMAPVRSLTAASTLAARNSGLELRALTHPNALFVGSDARFQVLFDGKPVASHVVTVHERDSRYSQRQAPVELKTNAAGELLLKLDAYLQR